MDDYYVDKDITLLTTRTLFRIDNKFQILVENHNQNCTHLQIDQMIAKRLINNIDIFILRLLAQYRYLNGYNIAFFLNHCTKQLSDFYKKDTYSKNLKKLYRAGLLLRYCLCDEKSKLTSNPLRFYDLSPGAYSYINGLVDMPHNFTSATTDLRKIELLSLNQFLIRFTNHYSSHIKKYNYLLRKKIGRNNFVIDSFICISLCNKILSYSIMSLFVFAARRIDDYLIKLIERLRFTFLYIEQHLSEYKIFMIILLVEDISMIIEIYKHIQSIPLLSEQPIYYSLDSNACIYPPLESIFTCEHSETDNRICIKQVRILI